MLKLPVDALNVFVGDPVVARLDVVDPPVGPHRSSAWFKKGSGTVAGTARRVLGTTVPDPFLDQPMFRRLRVAVVLLRLGNSLKFNSRCRSRSTARTFWKSVLYIRLYSFAVKRYG